MTRANSTCAYTNKLTKFKAMMEPRGHEVTLYGGEGADVECYPADADLPEWTSLAWAPYNGLLISAMMGRVEDGDFVCLMNGAGGCNEPLSTSFPQAITVESGIGYQGTFCDYRVFESYAWMHAIYGQQETPYKANGKNQDVVIHNYHDPAEFPFVTEKEDYLLYMGRMVTRKGIEIVEQVCEKIGARVIFAGGEAEYTPSYGEVLGPVGPDERAELMSKAKALFAPTLYIEPGGGVMQEAQFCGTPVLTSPWGVMSETVENGVTGFHGRSMGQFIWAIEHLADLDPAAIRDSAVARWSLEATAPKYEVYFDYLNRLQHGEGWYDEEPLPSW